MSNSKRNSSSGLTLAIVEDLIGKGWSQTEIAEAYGVTRQYVSWIRSYYSGRRTPVEQYRKFYPWKVPSFMGQTAPYRNSRYHLEYLATKGVGMNDEALKRLRSWYRKLRDENVVLEFDPDIPPIAGVSSQGGFAYRPRTPDDGDLLIRVNEHTDITEEGKLLWRFPAVEP